jgi:hypothetical protein
VGPPQYPFPSRPNQQASCHCRQRLCLLKGCERPFQPRQPQQRYCSAACRQQAACWRRWRSGQRYRASAAGKQQRRQQSRRYRQRRQQQRAACWEEKLRAIHVQVTQEAVAAATQLEEVTAQLEPQEPREGQRPAPPPQDFPCLPCQRPGCYVLFPLRPSVPQQRFCCCLCRRALRRVLDREARWRWRRRQRHGPVQPGQRSRSPPAT